MKMNSVCWKNFSYFLSPNILCALIFDYFQCVTKKIEWAIKIVVVKFESRGFNIKQLWKLETLTGMSTKRMLLIMIIHTQMLQNKYIFIKYILL